MNLRRTSGAVPIAEEDRYFLMSLRSSLISSDSGPGHRKDLRRLFDATKVPTSIWGCAVTLYQPGVDRLMVVRVAQQTAFENVWQAMKRVPKHPRFGEFDLGDHERCRLQVDFIVDNPELVELSTLSDRVLPEQGAEGVSREEGRVAKEEGPVPSEQTGSADRFEVIGSAWQVQVVSTWPVAKPLTRFEFGIDGLRIMKEGRRRYFLPGDAFVRSILGMGQLWRHVRRLFPGDDISDLTFYRFRSSSFVSSVKKETWLPLYRGMPPTPNLNDTSLLEAARAGTKQIADSLQSDGRFIYYYDAATDTRRDHEHPTRDPKTNPYYNLLRHSGGVVTLLLEEQLRQGQVEFAVRTRDADEASTGQSSGPHSRLYDLNSCESSYKGASHRVTIERALDFFVEQLTAYQTQDGKEAAYALYNRKAKLGGSGIGLYALALYQRLFEDNRYASAAQRLANHLVSEINERGEFRYYHVYLDEPVAWSENQRYFSFYYPGEAILGLSHYCQHVCQSIAERRMVFDKTHQALRFLFRERPRLHKEHYQTLPSDSWLMMAITDLWDAAEFRQDEYKQFVFDDADQMVRLMYTEKDALYPDYVGSFYYQYGDHPYPDGARAEGLLGAYQLAIKVGDQRRIERYRDACDRVAIATLRLCNTPDSVYSARNPEQAVGGIRFKLTRQWFRVDTIQHVASFYLKLLGIDEP